MDNKFFIIRGDRSGVFFAQILKREGRDVWMADCRRLWYWSGAASLSQLATEGVKNPKDCKFSMTVSKALITDAIEILPCTDEAVSNIQAVPIWKI